MTKETGGLRSGKAVTGGNMEKGYIASSGVEEAIRIDCLAGVRRRGAQNQARSSFTWGAVKQWSPLA